MDFIQYDENHTLKRQLSKKNTANINIIEFIRFHHRILYFINKI